MNVSTWWMVGLTQLDEWMFQRTSTTPQSLPLLPRRLPYNNIINNIISNIVRVDTTDATYYLTTTMLLLLLLPPPLLVLLPLLLRILK